MSVSERRELHNYVEEVLGARAYLVGGSVRDELLGIPCDDWDFTTQLLPDEIEKAVRQAGRKPILTGKRHGTIMFKTPDGKHKIEVTSHRTEVYEPGSRQPVASFGCSLNEDLLRRDFTINAIARRSDGRIIDPFGGRSALVCGVLETPDKPKKTFNEDPLRMLRAVRFVSRFGLSVEARTFAAMQDRAHRILMPKIERCLTELDKLLVVDHPAAGLRLLSDSRVLNFILPELALQVGYDQNSKYHEYTLWEHTLRVVSGVPADLDLRWAALLHDIAKPAVAKLNAKTGRTNYIKHDMLGAKMSEALCRRLRMSNDRIERVSSLVESHLLVDSPLKEADDAAKGDPDNLWNSPAARRLVDSLVPRIEE
jgi:poly(A) polymerase